MPDSPDRRTAIEQLEALGLSSYAARTFVALVALDGGTAEEVSETADVPRTRVYDAVEELEAEGLADVQYTTPREFWAVSPETAGRRFEREYARRVTALTDALDGLGEASVTAEQRGVWTATGRETVTDRVVEFVEGAEKEVVYMTVERLLDEAVVSALAAASDRGVDIRVAGLSESVRGTLREAVPAAEPFDSLWVPSETAAGRLLMVDRERTLVSVLMNGGGGTPEETAIRGSGETNGLVVVLRAVFTWQLEDREDGA